jgi:porin
MNERPHGGLILLAVTGLLSAHGVCAQAVDVPDSWGGTFLSRPRLTGAWGGVRDELGHKGIVLDVDLLLTPQSVLSGGRSTGSALWGNLDYTLNIDTHKVGLWQGGFLKLEGDTGFGANVLKDSGALVPVNTPATLPANGAHTSALMNATLLQLFGEKLGVMVGKINTLDLGETEFYGNYHTQFLNMAFLSPMTLEQVPISAWGAGVIALPGKDLALSVLILNPNGTPTTNPVFGPGVMVQPNAQITVHPFGLLGHQAVSASWNDRKRYSLDQDPSNIALLLLSERFPKLANPGPELVAILEQFFPQLLVPTVPPNTKSSSWALSYTFDQYVWQPDKGADGGIGVFFAYGASDGNPNPLRYSLIAGIGGKNVVPGRAADTFGLGFGSTRFSSEFVPLLRERLDLGLQREDAFEMYYNAAICGWLTASADLQIVKPALTRVLVGTQLSSVDTAVVAGLRLWARF